jgi:serine/threonine protein kinase
MTIAGMEGSMLENRFSLHNKLGSGNFGTVYRANELLNGVPVRETALKLFTPEVTAKGNIDGMLRDCAFPARIMSSDAPDAVKRHFIQIYGWGTVETPVGKCAYVSMELIKHPVTLQNIIERHRDSGFLPEAREVTDAMVQFFEALSAAHEAGVLHRDIKGANVLMSGGVLKLLDFGMGAECVDPGAALLTTVTCYAPEDFHGSHTARSDIYQAGLLFYEYWTGVHPFASAGYHHMRRDVDMLDAEMERLRWVYKHGSSLPGVRPDARLDLVLSRCLKLDPVARYASASVVLDALLKPEGLEEALAAATAALEHGDAETAVDVAGNAVSTHPADDSAALHSGDAVRVKLLVLLGCANGRLGRAPERLKALLEAYRIAVQKGVYFMDDAQHDALVENIAAAYEAAGQAMMARLFRKKKKC